MLNDNSLQSAFFSGKAKKIKIVSNCLGYGPCPQPDDEAEQHLTITADGRVYFSSYSYGDGRHYTKAKTRNFKIPCTSAIYVLKVVRDYFSAEHELNYATDVGDWKITLVNTDGDEYKEDGSLCPMSNEFDKISEIIRYNLDMPELLLFNGEAHTDRIERIVVDYHRNTKIKPGQVPDDVSWEYVTWDYTERLTIDRKSETLEHIQNIGIGCHVSRKYNIEDGITSFLDDLNADEFMSHTEGNPPDVVKNPLETKDYTITIDYLYGEQRVLVGTFDKKGLPDDFSDFAENVFDFMRFYGMGEILDPSVHGKPLRKTSDYIFCNVVFEGGGKTYCYLTEDGTLEVDDYVVVPAGKDNHETIAQIESIEYHPAEEAPFPLDRIKSIIRKSDDKDGEDDNSIIPPEGAVVMCEEPIPGVSADEWRSMLGENYSEAALAASLAGAWNEAGWLADEVDGDDCTEEIKAKHDAWWELQVELVKKVATVLQCEFAPPYNSLVTPFMIRNSYRDGCGWWVKDENR